MHLSQCFSEGNLPDIQKAGSLHEFLMILHKNYGDIASFWFGHQLTVSIASPQLFKEHAKPFDRPRKFLYRAAQLLKSFSIRFLTRLISDIYRKNLIKPTYPVVSNMTC